MRKSISYSQNFLKDKNLVARLIAASSIAQNDVIYEIGAGTGIITEELLKKSGKVVAFEIDKNLFNKLATKFANDSALVLRNTDFLGQNLPSKPYKVFSNIPFNITASIIKKLTQFFNPPQDSYLIIQKEAAQKFVGKPLDFKNSQISILIKPWFKVEIVYRFQRNDFIPRPNVNVVLLELKKRETPLIEYKNKHLYEDFITYAFNQFKPNVIEGLSDVFGLQSIKKLSSQFKFSPRAKPSEIEFGTWLELFAYFLNKLDKSHQSIVKGWSTRIKEQEQKIEKINRTRVDKNWKKFKSKTSYTAKYLV